MYQQQDAIERCPHDKYHPFSIVSNELIRDDSISPNCRWLLIYLLSMADNWKIRVSHLTNILKPHMGRDAVRKILKEAVESGYMCRIEFKEGNLKRWKYQFSETPKFKKSFPCTGFQRVETPTGGSSPPKKEQREERTIEKNPPLPPPKKEKEEAPSTEEEEEICRRLKNRPLAAPPITVMREWRKEVLRDIRRDRANSDDGQDNFEKHKKIAQSMDMKRFGDWMVFACPGHVEFTSGSQIKIVTYESPDRLWVMETERYWGKI